LLSELDELLIRFSLKAEQRIDSDGCLESECDLNSDNEPNLSPHETQRKTLTVEDLEVLVEVEVDANDGLDIE
jgi:hypothetical protein